MKKAQGLPIYAIAIVIIGVIAVALILLYVFGVFGEGKALSLSFFHTGGNVTENASQTVEGYFG